MWMLGPISIGAVGSAAMMLWSPFYWGLYLSMSPEQPVRRVAAAAPKQSSEVRVAKAGDDAPPLRQAA